jgi:hypothetical protein
MRITKRNAQTGLNLRLAHARNSQNARQAAAFAIKTLLILLIIFVFHN